MAMRAARPVPLSEMPGPRRRAPSWRTFTSVEGGKTVSRWAERTSDVSANCVLLAGRLLCGMLADLAGMVKRITQRAACFIAEFRATFGTKCRMKFGAFEGINCARPRRRG